MKYKFFAIFEKWCGRAHPAHFIHFWLCCGISGILIITTF